MDIKIKKTIFLLLVILTGCGRSYINTEPVKNNVKKAPLKKRKSERPEKSDHNFYKKGFKQRGTASWYGPQFHGKASASGETFDMNAISAAHKYLPINSKIKVTEVSSGKSITLLVKDRGPYIHGRIVDLSKKAAQKLGYFDRGLTDVELELLKLPEDIPDYYIVQMGKFNTLENAIADQKKLVKEHFPAFITGNEKEGFVLVVGPFTAESRAYDYRDKIEAKGFQKGFVREFISQ